MDSQKQYMPVRLYYEVSVPYLHDPNLSPLILLHGTGALHSCWNRVNKQIANKTRRKVFSLDLRNHGQSEWSEHNSLRDYEADIENFLSENDIKKCVIAGHSLGGRIALFFALRKPHLVEKIITEEMVVSNPDSNVVEELVQVIAAAKKIYMLPKGLDEVNVRYLFSRLIAEKYPNQKDFIFFTPLKKNCDGSYVFDFNIDAIERTFKDQTAYFIDFEECQTFLGPALVIFAESSPKKVDQDEKMKEFFPNAEFCKFKTCAHVLHSEKPDEFIKIVSDFINK